MSVKVKICGVTRVADAVAAARAGADFLGVNFWPGSPRRVTRDAAHAIAAAVPGVPLVGVFVDAPRAEVLALVDAVGLSAVQFHGAEDPTYCTGWAVRTIKALRPHPGERAADLAAPYATDWFMLDSFVAGVPGGTGVAVDTSAADGLPRERLFVAGGLRPETVADVVRLMRPYAVDVASGVETRPGEKDHGKLEEFIRRAKAA